MDNLLDFTTTGNGVSKKQTKLKNSTGYFVSIMVVISITFSLVISLPIYIAHGQQQQQQSSSSTGNSGKVVILPFGDTLKSQITTAKPILDKYGFKASFFITCDWTGLQTSRTPRLAWQDISLLQKDGHDIESKTMTHRDLSKLSAADLNFEVAASKKCLSDYGINSTIFATPHGNSWDNPAVILLIMGLLL
jgi:peptidoglycan/xylan/chitin deacetylase (PgdA/CDA1 family)